MSKEKIKRNQKLFNEYLKGRSSLRAIARKYNINHPRELQIINYMKQLSPRKTKKMLKVEHLIRGSKKY